MTVIALTGGLAAGKSTAARYLGELGAHVIDADILGHRAYEPGMNAYTQVVAEFGTDILADDQQIDRKILGSKVFGRPDALERLTDIVWPEIRRLAEAEIEAVKTASPDRLIVLEAAVLFEAGWDDIGDETWVIFVEPQTAIDRAVARDGADPDAIQKRLDAQLSNRERIEKSNLAIENAGDEAELKQQLKAAFDRVA